VFWPTKCPLTGHCQRHPRRSLEKFGGLDSLVYKDSPEPEPEAGHVVIEIKAFGINHAKMHMRRGEWAEAAPVSGIEGWVW
jgi:NADPH:quinone reductase-like Zn-dependent oxidoreductase